MLKLRIDACLNLLTKCSYIFENKMPLNNEQSVVVKLTKSISGVSKSADMIFDKYLLNEVYYLTRDRLLG